MYRLRCRYLVEHEILWWRPLILFITISVSCLDMLPFPYSHSASINQISARSGNAQHSWITVSHRLGSTTLFLRDPRFPSRHFFSILSDSNCTKFGENMGELQHSTNTFRFKYIDRCCSIWKLGWFRGDWGRKQSKYQTFYPCKNYESDWQNLEWIFVLHLRPNLWYTFGGGSSAGWDVRNSAKKIGQR